MLKDELELITGTLINGDVTFTVFNLLKPSEVFEQVCDDVKRIRGESDVHLPDTTPDTVENFGRGFDIVQWLSSEGQPLTL